MFKIKRNLKEEECIEELKCIVRSLWKLDCDSKVVCSELKSRVKKYKLNSDMPKMMAIKGKLEEIKKMDILCWGNREEELYESILDLIYK